MEPVSLIERLGVPGLLLAVVLFYLWKFTDLQKEVAKKADQDNVDRDIGGIRKDVNNIGTKVNIETKERLSDKSRVQAAIAGVAIKAGAPEIIKDLLADK